MKIRTRLLLAGLGLALSACAAFRPPPPVLPLNGPILYRCADGTQLSVEFDPDGARVAIVGGYSMVLPSTGTSEAPAYSNGRFSLDGGGRSATWHALNRAPVACSGQ